MAESIKRVGGLPIVSRAEFEKAWAKRRYIEYCKYVHEGVWIPGRHHALVCEALDKVIRGEIDRLMIWMPPQHGKSMCVTETFPSYYLGHYPDRHVIEASYNDDYARKFGRKNREKVTEYGRRLWDLTLSQVNFGQSNWDLGNHRGGMLSVGIGGAATGAGADLLIIDDPIKNREEADSATYRNKLWDEYTSTFRTRVHPGGAIIVVMTRWHEDDICGRLLNPEYGEPENWTILKLPGVCEDEDDLLGRQIGEPLWPEMGYDSAWLEKQKTAVGSYAFAGLYQQRPAPAEGGILKRAWFKFYEVLPDNISRSVQSWDCTFKDAKSSDFVAGHVWAQAGPNYYLLDRVHDRMGIADTMQAIRTLTYKHPTAFGKLVEDKANGTAVIELLRKEISGLIPIDPQGGKVVRAQAIAPYAEAGNIYLPHPKIAPWVHDFLEECAAFPNAAHDDDVDAMTQAINYMSNTGGYSMPPEDYGYDKESYWR